MNSSLTLRLLFVINSLLLEGTWASSINQHSCTTTFLTSAVKDTEFKALFDKARSACKCSPMERSSTESRTRMVLEMNDERQDSDECKTKDGIPCEFPFRYKGKKYKRCTNEDLGGVVWCKTGRGEWDFGACNTTNPACMDSYAGGCPSKNPTAACYFPFKYKGSTYNGCTLKDYGIRWCGTAPEVDILNWAECEPTCPNDDSQSELCVLNELGWIKDNSVSKETIEAMILSSLDKKPELRATMMKALKTCFEDDHYHHPEMEGYLEGVENANKLACFKINFHAITSS